MRSGSARLLSVSPAAPIPSHLGAEDVTEGRTLPPSCAALEAQRQDMRSGSVRLLTVSSATPVLGQLGTKEVTEGRTLPPPYSVWDAQRQVPPEWD